jgi:hypothetical protein
MDVDGNWQYWRNEIIMIMVHGQGLSGSMDFFPPNRRVDFAVSLAVERRSEPADRGLVDDGQTNSVSFDTICLAVERRRQPSRCLCR